MVVLLRPRQAPPGQAAGGLDSVVPGVSGSIVIQPTLSAAEDDTVLGLDPSGIRGSDTRVFPTALSTNNNGQITPTPTSTPDQEGSREQKAKTSTLTVAIVAVAAFLIIAGGALLLFCRRSKDRRRTAQRRSTGGRQRGHWREIETHQSQSGHGHGQPGPPPIPMRANPFDDSHKAMDSRSMYSTAHTIGTHFAHEPLMAANPFADSPTTASAPVPSMPTMPTIQHVQQPQQPLVQHHVDPHSGGFSAPSEYTASYIRSVYSATTDSSSVAESTATIVTPRSRSNTLKRAPERDKNQYELVALDNLIAALDFNTDHQQGGSGSGGQQTLPDPSLFRAALGGGAGSSIGGHGSSSRPHSPAPGSQQSHNAH